MITFYGLYCQNSESHLIRYTPSKYLSLGFSKSYVRLPLGTKLRKVVVDHFHLKKEENKLCWNIINVYFVGNKKNNI